MPDTQDHPEAEAAAASTSLKRRLFWLLICTTLGLGIGLLGNYLAANPRWFLALPAAIAIGWLFFANPEACLPPAGKVTVNKSHTLAHDIALTIYCARTGDHNARAMTGALSLGQALSTRLGLAPTIIGQPVAPLYKGWQHDLSDAMPALAALAAHLDKSLELGQAPLLVLNRCAAALATLPALVRHRPDACVVWFDAHGDLNTPETTPSGYLGGMALAGPAGLWETGLGSGLPLANIILVGARDLDPAEQALVDNGQISLIAADRDSPHKLRAALAGRAAYVHLDCDVLEPGSVPTDYRVPGGFPLNEFYALCQVLAEGEIIGLEIAEFEDTWADGNMPVSPNALLDALEPAITRLAAG